VFDLFPISRKISKKRKGGDPQWRQQQQLAMPEPFLGKPQNCFFFLLDEPTEGIQPSIIQDIEIAVQPHHERNRDQCFAC